MRRAKTLSFVLFFSIFFSSSMSCFASMKKVDSENHFELGVAKSKVLGEDVYIPNITFGNFSYLKQPAFQLTFGFLSEDVSSLRNGKLQELKNFFYIGPQFSKKYRLRSRLYSEVGVAVLTGSLGYKVSSTTIPNENNSSDQHGIYFGVRPEVKFIFDLRKDIAFVFTFNYFVMSNNVDEGAADIGPSVGLGFRRNFGR